MSNSGRRGSLPCNNQSALDNLGQFHPAFAHGGLKQFCSFLSK
jgi:hypothetical protein